MDDPGALRVFPARRLAGQRLHERPVAVAAGGMDHHAGRLVDHHQVLVLPGDAERTRRALGSGAAASGAVTETDSPPESTWRLGRGSPSTET
jgi:hypothetical protein